MSVFVRILGALAALVLSMHAVAAQGDAPKPQPANELASP